MARIIYLILGLILGLVGFTLAFTWFGGKLALVIFLVLWSNNITIDDVNQRRREW